jgi:phage terminase large subunit
VNIETQLEKAFGIPTEKQQQFFTAKTRYVGYGGAKGGGKSHGVRLKSTLLAYEFPGIRMLVVRRTLPELKENHVTRLLSAYQILEPAARPRYSSDDKAFTFPNGSRLKLGYCDNEQDVLQYQGQENDVAFLDEATQLSESQFGWIDATVRGVNRYPKRTYLTCNPGGVGHAWVKRLFIDRAYRRAERAKDYAFIHAKVWDNQPLFDSDIGYLEAVETLKKEHKLRKLTPELDMKAKWEADYVRQLMSLPEQLRRAWLEGDWTVFEGQYFTEWDEDAHVIKPIPLSTWWRKSASIDYGLDMFAALWVAIDEKGQSYVYRNIEESNLPVEYAIAKFKRAMGAGESLDAVYGPPDLWNRHSDSGISTADIFAKHGLPLIMSSNARESGWLNVKEYLKKADGYGNTTGYPRMKIFSTCAPLTTNIPLLQFDPKKINDVATQPHEITHSPDALRGWCSMRQLGTKKPEEIKPDPFNIRRKVKNKVNGFLMGGYGV